VISLLKKLLAAMFALLCVFMLCACANQTSDPDNKVQDSDISDEMQQNPADVDIPPVSDPGPDPVTDPVEDPAPVPDDEKDMQVSLEEVRAAILDQLSINDPLLLDLSGFEWRLRRMGRVISDNGSPRRTSGPAWTRPRRPLLPGPDGGCGLQRARSAPPGTASRSGCFPPQGGSPL